MRCMPDCTREWKERHVALCLCRSEEASGDWRSRWDRSARWSAMHWQSGTKSECPPSLAFGSCQGTAVYVDGPTHSVRAPQTAAMRTRSYSWSSTLTTRTPCYGLTWADAALHTASSEKCSRQMSTSVACLAELPKCQLRRSEPTATDRCAVAPPRRAVGPARQRRDSSARPTCHEYRRLAVAPSHLPSRRGRTRRRLAAKRLAAMAALTEAEVAIGAGSSTERTLCRRRGRSHACLALVSQDTPSLPSSGKRICTRAQRALRLRRGHCAL